MTVRDAKKEDLEQIKKIADKNGITIPKEGKLIVAETKTGSIAGFVNIRPVFMIEPFICENPLGADRLWEYIQEKSKEGQVKILRCFAQEKHLRLFKKLGFYRIFKKHIPLEINFY
jgi:N-acetylglutamate synthase-like GNAT family acetyltransferase